MKTNEIYTGKEILMFKLFLNGWADSRRHGGKGRLSFEDLYQEAIEAQC